MSRPIPLGRESFHVFRQLQSRWSDNDIYGHMNNVVHYALFDTAINGWLVEKDLLDLKNGETIGLVVETGCHYFAELAFPDRIDAGIGVERIGSSSVIYRIALFRDEDTTAAAQGRFVHVYVDRETRRSKPLDAHWRETLEGALL